MSSTLIILIRAHLICLTREVAGIRTRLFIFHLMLRRLFWIIMILHGCMSTKISFFTTRFYCKRNICGDSSEFSFSLHASFCHHLNVGPRWWIQTSWGTLFGLMLMWWEIAARCKYSWREQRTFDNVAVPSSTTPADAKKEGRRAAAQLSFIIDRATEAVIVEDHHEERRSLRITNESASKEYIYVYQHYSTAHHLHRWKEGIQRRGIFQPNIYSSGLVKGCRGERNRRNRYVCAHRRRRSGRCIIWLPVEGVSLLREWERERKDCKMDGYRPSFFL